MSAVPPRPKRSLFSLIGDLPGLVMDLVRSEIEHLKQELITRIAQAGTGIALLAVGASVLFFALGAFVTAASVIHATVPNAGCVRSAVPTAGHASVRRVEFTASLASTAIVYCVFAV